MLYSVVIPTNRAFSHIEPLLQSLINQILVPSQIVIVYDQYCTVEEFEEYEYNVTQIFYKKKLTKIDIIHPLTDPIFKVGKGASYVRNY